MIEIRTLAQLNTDDLQRLVTGYASEAKFRVSKMASDERFVLTLELIPLLKPFYKRFDHLDEEAVEFYQKLPEFGFSVGAYSGEQCVGIALSEPHYWNGSLWVREIHVAETHRRLGVGRQLLDVLAEKARADGLRILVCETQNTNVPALRFYQNAGFNIEGIDLSYYSNEDFPDGEIAVFMKKRLLP